MPGAILRLDAGLFSPRMKDALALPAAEAVKAYAFTTFSKTSRYLPRVSIRRRAFLRIIS